MLVHRSRVGTKESSNRVVLAPAHRLHHRLRPRAPRLHCPLPSTTLPPLWVAGPDTMWRGALASSGCRRSQMPRQLLQCIHQCNCACKHAHTCIHTRAETLLSVDQTARSRKQCSHPPGSSTMPHIHMHAARACTCVRACVRARSQMHACHVCMHALKRAHAHARAAA